MSLKGKTVFIVSAKNGKISAWQCIGEFSRTENGKVIERLCYLKGVEKYLTLPKRRVFDTYEAAKASRDKYHFA